MLRLFIGIKIESLPPITQFQAYLKKALQSDQINWVDPGNFHITLKFLGDVKEYYLNSIESILNSIASRYNSFTLSYGRLGVFGSRNQPRVIWFGFKQNPIIAQIQSAIENELLPLGFKKEDKEFYPHLTLGRVKRISNANKLFDYIEEKNPGIHGEYSISGFQLIRSILKPEGPEYKVVKEFQLMQSDTLSFKNNH